MSTTTNLLEIELERAETKAQLKVFGAERLRLDEGNMPSPEAIDELRNAIADAATDAGGMVWEGIYSRRTGPDSQNAHWSYGILRTYCITLSLTTQNILLASPKLTMKLWRPGSGLLPGKFRLTEDLEITDRGTAKINSQISPVNSQRSSTARAREPANAPNLGVGCR